MFAIKWDYHLQYPWNIFWARKHRIDQLKSKNLAR